MPGLFFATSTSFYNTCKGTTTFPSIVSRQPKEGQRWPRNSINIMEPFRRPRWR
ncbi:hypothetical protein CGCTS75_v003397 [Colletotrichum tropicale]|nr:hypothetical protein CGCTS75_v003397 [Colletotrichum tropicale]